MNTKYKHMMKFLQQQKGFAYAKGFRDGKRKSFAKGFLVGLVICKLISIFIAFWN